MNTNNKPNPHHKKTALLITTLLFITLLTFSSLTSTFDNVSPFVLGAPNKVVSTETELRNAINNAAGSTIITLNKDIQLTETLNIPTNKDITLTSNKIVGFYKLIGASCQETLIVKDSGMLKIDGVIVTHLDEVEGRGVTVDSGGTLILYSGEILGNTVYGVGMPQLVGGYGSYGGGVYNSGVFEMSGGKISGNLASIGRGGGVYNSGTFKLSGGEISGNSATTSTFTESENWGHGDGVYNMGTFTMSGGRITRNTDSGGGVYNYGTFELSGGEISYNSCGVYNRGVFTMLDGEISYNTGCGVYTAGAFTMSGGKISGNTAYIGGGVYVNWSGSFDRRGGVISGNTVTNSDGEGKDVYIHSGSGGSSGGGSSNSNNDSSNGSNGGGSGSNGEGSSGGGSGGVSNGDGFSLREVVIICVGVVGVTLAVVMAVLLFIFKKELNVQKERQTEIGCACDGGC